MKQPKLQTFKLKEGEKLNRNPNKPVISIVGSGRLTYLWIGNEAPEEGMCFATVAGPKRLLSIAKGIIRAVGKTK